MLGALHDISQGQLQSPCSEQSPGAADGPQRGAAAPQPLQEHCPSLAGVATTSPGSASTGSCSAWDQGSGTGQYGNVLKGGQKQGWSQTRLSSGEGTELRTAPSSPYTQILELASISITRVQGSPRSSFGHCCERTENPPDGVQAGWKEIRTTPGKVPSRKCSSCCPLHELSLRGRT